jgi:hypothetical protein
MAAMFDDEPDYVAHQLRGSSPLLQPVLAFYLHLYAANYSLASITGRWARQRPRHRWMRLRPAPAPARPPCERVPCCCALPGAELGTLT